MTTIAQADSSADRAAFLAERLTGIGGSDAAAVLGFNPYKTPFQVYLEKRGEAEPEDLSNKAAVEWGNRLEDVVAAAYAEKTGTVVRRVNTLLRSDQHPFAIAHLDRRIVGVKKGLEVKTAGTWVAQTDAWGEPGTDQVPEPYIAQVQHYMAVTDYVEFDLAVLIGGQDFRIYTIPRDEEFIAGMMAAEAEFWAAVQSGNPPAAVTIADARRRFPVSKNVEIEATAEIAQAESTLRVVEAELKATKAMHDDLVGQIQGFMGEADTLTRGGIRIRTWKSQHRDAYSVGASDFRVFRSVAPPKQKAVAA